MGDYGQVHEQTWVDVAADVCTSENGKHIEVEEHTIKSHYVAPAL
jgi:hypothetical protein